MSWPERAYEERDGQLVALNTWFYSERLRANPRFQDLLRRINFPETAATKGPRKNTFRFLAADPSHLAALFVDRTLPVCSLLAPCWGRARL